MTRKKFTDHLLNLGAIPQPGEPETYFFSAFSTLAITITANGAYTDLGLITPFQQEDTDNDRT